MVLSAPFSTRSLEEAEVEVEGEESGENEAWGCVVKGLFKAGFEVNRGIFVLLR